MATDYAEALKGLLPQGAAWECRDNVLQAVLQAQAGELERIDARAQALLAEADPGQANELLADWERVLGLPDPCLTTAQTLAERRAAARSRYTMVGGASAAFFIALAASMGHAITVEDFSSPDEATAAGITFEGDGWAYTWRVNLPVGTAAVPFRVGLNTAGQPLRDWGIEDLECLIKRYAPAHTIVLFAYT